MTAPVSVRYEFTYTNISNGSPSMFGLGSHITAEVAQGILTGLAGVPTITDAAVKEVFESSTTTRAADVIG